MVCSDNQIAEVCFALGLFASHHIETNQSWLLLVDTCSHSLHSSTGSPDLSLDSLHHIHQIKERTPVFAENQQRGKMGIWSQREEKESQAEAEDRDLKRLFHFVI